MLSRRNALFFQQFVFGPPLWLSTPSEYITFVKSVFLSGQKPPCEAQGQ